MSGRPFTRERAVAAFWSKVNKTGPIPAHRPDLGPCWLWTGARFAGTGYGAVRWEGRTRTAHSVALELERDGPLPDGLQALHSCDNRPCVRHLFAGTQADNVADAVLKGRFPFGERHGASKLTEQRVGEVWRLRHEGWLQREIAVALGVGRATIEDILARRTWRHVIGPGA